MKFDGSRHPSARLSGTPRCSPSLLMVGRLTEKSDKVHDGLLNSFGIMAQEYFVFAVKRQHLYRHAPEIRLSMINADSERRIVCGNYIRRAGNRGELGPFNIELNECWWLR